MRGFEVYRSIPESALQAGIKSAGSTAPQGTYTEAELWRRGSEFLLTMQNEQGAYTDSDYDFGGTDSLPNVYVAVTSLAGMALMAADSRLPDDSPVKAHYQKAIQKAAQFVSKRESINWNDRDEILWALAYRTRFLAGLAKQDQQFKPTLQAMVKDIESIQSRSG